MGVRPDGAHDVLVVGSGFGGSVAALRLTEKGYRVGVLEAGRRFTDETLPKTSWDLRRFLWAPAVGLHGIQRIHVLDDVVVLAGAGVGGGSLVYANTLYRPPDAFYDDPQWADITDWRSELATSYDQAAAMLGVVTNPSTTPADEAMQRVAATMGAADTFHPTPIGVFFGRDGAQEPGVTVPDPYFGGAGPDRTGCIQCGECMIGCRHGAKNRLDLNYLALAEAGGAVIRPGVTVTAVRPLPDGGYAVDTMRSGRTPGARPDRTFTAAQVVLAAGTYGTQELLHTMRADGILPNVSARLGELTRTNSEALLGATSRDTDTDYTQGVAITSSWHPDADTHIEPVRYGKGSNAMGLLSTLLVDGGGPLPRWLTLLITLLKDPGQLRRALSVRRWSQKTIIVLAMQSLDNSLTTSLKRGRLGRGRRLASQQGHGAPNPSWLPVGHEVTRRLADDIGGDPGGTWGDIFNVPMTAHFLGGAPIGADAESGVIDAYHRLFGHEGIHVVDGAAVSANLGVNPSLTITALAERALALWPNKGETDPRPALGAGYVRVDAVRPHRPIVPSHAPAALKVDAVLSHSPAPSAVHTVPSVVDPVSGNVAAEEAPVAAHQETVSAGGAVGVSVGVAAGGEPPPYEVDSAANTAFVDLSAASGATSQDEAGVAGAPQTELPAAIDDVESGRGSTSDFESATGLESTTATQAEFVRDVASDPAADDDATTIRPIIGAAGTAETPDMPEPAPLNVHPEDEGILNLQAFLSDPGAPNEHTVVPAPETQERRRRFSRRRSQELPVSASEPADGRDSDEASDSATPAPAVYLPDASERTDSSSGARYDTDYDADSGTTAASADDLSHLDFDVDESFYADDFPAMDATDTATRGGRPSVPEPASGSDSALIADHQAPDTTIKGTETETEPETTRSIETDASAPYQPSHDAASDLVSDLDAGPDSDSDSDSDSDTDLDSDTEPAADVDVEAAPGTEPAPQDGLTPIDRLRLRRNRPSD